jgi:heterodisulfide reductase subunit C
MSVASVVDPVQQAARDLARACYQCGKCSAGCPVGEYMDMLPNRLIRLVQSGRMDKAAASQAAWLCVSCQTCTARCPQGVDCAGIMDALREWSFAHGGAGTLQNRTVIFQRAFLENIRRNGRLNEFELVGRFKTKAFLTDLSVPMLFKDAMLGPQMLRRGKFHLRGEKVRDRGLVARIFEKCSL